MRGDRPFLGRQRDTIWKFTPHARGSTVFVASVVVRVSVYPACAGIDLTLRFQRAAFRSLPRMRGDRPALATSLMSTARFTPHARGSTCELVGYALKGGVYPACAGIDHGSPRETQMWDCLPRMRGDRPSAGSLFFSPLQFTPHARGSTLRMSSMAGEVSVYPACAGIDPIGSSLIASAYRLPRMRGDRP